MDSREGMVGGGWDRLRGCTGPTGIGGACPQGGFALASRVDWSGVASRRGQPRLGVIRRSAWAEVVRPIAWVRSEWSQAPSWAGLSPGAGLRWMVERSRQGASGIVRAGHRGAACRGRARRFGPHGRVWSHGRDRCGRSQDSDGSDTSQGRTRRGRPPGRVRVGTSHGAVRAAASIGTGWVRLMPRAAVACRSHCRPLFRVGHPLG